jgi:hypothetical protein
VEKKMKIKSLTFVITLLLITSFQANAADALSADAIKTLIVGNTVNGEHLIKGFKFTAYFKADGTAIRNWDGDVQDGTYFFKNNLHCVNFGGGDKCAAMVPKGDGS